jgi:two-component system chemotaxis response regulator CheY
MENKFQNFKILVVEDDENTRITIKIMLQETGITKILEAEDGQKADDVILEHHSNIDLIISDWNMPNKTGFEFLKELRSERPDIPFLMVTARADHDSVLNAKDFGADGYLLKPFTLEEFKKKLITVIYHNKSEFDGYDPDDIMVV